MGILDKMREKQGLSSKPPVLPSKPKPKTPEPVKVNGQPQQPQAKPQDNSKPHPHENAGDKKPEQPKKKKRGPDKRSADYLDKKLQKKSRLPDGANVLLIWHADPADSTKGMWHGVLTIPGFPVFTAQHSAQLRCAVLLDAEYRKAIGEGPSQPQVAAAQPEAKEEKKD